ncbi:MAG: hypothetical protein QGG40_09610, partial [Myxococcota bacterium]|nr:hypothetical protein [Myxococcota bacterium]
MFLALFACTGAPDGSVDSDDGLVGCAVDVHEHFDISLDFSTGIGTLHDDMAQVGVTHALIQTPPVSGLSLVGARYTFETDMTPSLQDAAAHNADLFLVAGGGILNPWIDQTDPGDAGPEMLTAFADEAGRILDAGAVGFGELALLHLSIDNTHPFIEIDPGHPLVLELARVAGRRGVPLDIHLELVDGADLAVADLPSACFETESDGGNNPDTLTENRSAFETLLEENASAADTEA